MYHVTILIYQEVIFMKKISFKRLSSIIILSIAFSILFTLFSVVNALNYGVESCINVTHSGLSGFGFGNYFNEMSRYQTFINGNNRCLESVDLKLRKVFGTNQTDVVVELREFVNGKPGAVLAKATIPADIIRHDWTVVKAPLWYSSLIPGKEYAIQLTQSQKREARYEWATAPVDSRYKFGKLRTEERRDALPNVGSWTYYVDIYTDESGLGDGCMKVWCHNDLTVTDLSHNILQGNGFGNSYNEIKRYQTFFVSGKYNKIKSIDLRLRKFEGSSQSDIKVELYKVSNKVPTGSALASAIIPATRIYSSWTLVSVPFEYTALDFKGEYAIVLSQITPQTSRYEWAVSNVSSDTSFGKWIGYTWVNESSLGDGYLKVNLDTDDKIIIDQTNEGESANSFGNTFDEIKRFQTFIADSSMERITGVDLRLRKVNGTGQSDVVVQLYETKDRMPIGSAIASTSIPASLIGSGWTVVNAPLKYNGLVRNREYAVVLTQSTLNSARYEWAKGFLNKGDRFGKWTGSWVDESGIGTAWMRVILAQKCDMIDQSSNPIGGFGFGNNHNEIKRFQTFYYSTGGTRKIDGIDLKIRKYLGSAQSDVVVELYRLSNGFPAGTPLASATIPSNSVGSDWTVVHAPLKYDYIYQGTVYAIVLGQKSPQNERYEWAASQVDSSLDFGKWNGTSWINESFAGDGWMKVWTRPYEYIKNINHNSQSGYSLGNYYDDIKRFQTFTVPYATCKINSIDLKLRKIGGSNQSDLIVQLYETNNKEPAKPISVAVIPSTQIGNDWTIVTADISCTLNSGKTYAVVLSQRTEGPSRYEWATGYVDHLVDFGKWDGYQWINESGLGDGWLTLKYNVQ